MIAAIVPVSAVLLSVAILLMGNGLQGTLLPVRAGFEAFSSIEIGLLGSTYFMGFAAGCLLGPWTVRRVGHIRAFTAMVAIASTTALVHALFVMPAIWWLLRAITGFCFAVLYMIIESWLNERSTNETRGLIFSVYTIINLTVLTIGQLMITLDEPRNFSLFALASILVSLAAVPVALTTAQAPAPIAAVTVRFRHLYKISPVGFAGALAVGLANGSFWALGPVFAQTEEGDVTAVALFMSTAVIAGAFGQWPLGRASDKTDRRKVIALVCIGATIAACTLVATHQIWDHGLLLTVFAFGLFTFPLYALSAAHMNDFVEPDGFVEAASGLLLIYSVGAVIGPLLSSTMMRYWGNENLFVFTAVVHVAMAVFTVYRMRRRRPASTADRASFVDALRVTQTISAVDPMSKPEAKGTSGDPESDPRPSARDPNLEGAGQQPEAADPGAAGGSGGAQDGADVDVQEDGDKGQR